jgi:drug/metabolite transporter (DMT)-like permease
MIWTTAGNAGFITSFYVIFVPFASYFLGKKILGSQWISAVIALAGLFLIGGTGLGPWNPGDLLVLLSAFFWTAHVLMVENGVRNADPLVFSFIQFFICGLVSLAVGFVLESPDWASVASGWWTIVYGGIFSVGIAYTLQVVAQTKVPASHAVVLLSLESVFAFAFGALFLGERLGMTVIFGGILVFGAVIISQLGLLRNRKEPS